MSSEMAGQWSAEISGSIPATLRIDLEDRGQGCFGHAYLFYPSTDIPGFLFQIHLPNAAPFRSKIKSIYLWPQGGVMSTSERVSAEQFMTDNYGGPLPSEIDVIFSLNGNILGIDWSTTDGQSGTISAIRSDPSGPSDLVSRVDITSWNEFRQWAVTQRPRNYIFRGQRNPNKLVTSFHRTWRNDLRSWIADDVSFLFGAVAERLTYPLQIGNLQHNAAIWSILQHHGYPTPLLDWSFSPFVAAYFAFQGADQTGSKPRIYMFDQASWNQRYGRANFIVDAAPDQLIVLESMGVANPRHGPQQAISTVTNVADVEEFIARKEQDDGVGYLTVCDLPAESRPQIMRELELMGITYGSLFPGLDGICRDMRDRLFARPI
jgi:hypothetical protein